MTTLSTLRAMPSTKNEVQRFSDMLKNELLSGMINPLELTNLKKSILAVFENIKTELDDLALAEAEKYSAKSFEAFGMKISIGENGTKYDYENCNDPIFNRIKSDSEAISQRMKDRQEMLKTIREPMIITDPETGETATVNPPIKTSTTGLRVSLI